jgi:hypothetical protein
MHFRLPSATQIQFQREFLILLLIIIVIPVATGNRVVFIVKHFAYQSLHEQARPASIRSRGGALYPNGAAEASMFFLAMNGAAAGMIFLSTK